MRKERLVESVMLQIELSQYCIVLIPNTIPTPIYNSSTCATLMQSQLRLLNILPSRALISVLTISILPSPGSL